jgi:transposase
MRYDLTDFEWSVIEPILPMDRRGPKPRNNRRVLNGIFWLLRDRRPVARSARALWALHKRIQPLQSLAQGGHLGPPDGRRTR